MLQLLRDERDMLQLLRDDRVGFSRYLKEIDTNNVKQYKINILKEKLDTRNCKGNDRR